MSTLGSLEVFSWFHHSLHHHLSEDTCEDLPGWVPKGICQLFPLSFLLPQAKLRSQLHCHGVWLSHPVRFLLNSTMYLVIQWCCHFPMEREWEARMKWPAFFFFNGKRLRYPCLCRFYFFSMIWSFADILQRSIEGSHTSVILWKCGRKIVDYLTFNHKLIYPSTALKSLGLFQTWVMPKVCSL